MKFLKFLCQRVITFVIVVFIGVTTVFFVPRFLPSDPIDAAISKMRAKSSMMTVEEIRGIREALSDSFGLEGSLASQYAGFLKRAFVSHDFGASFSNYPTPVNDIIARALPWTLGLLLSTTLITWIFGNMIGLIAGFRKNKWYAKTLEGISIVLYPIPYYILALGLIILLAYLWPVFPLSFVVRGSGWALVKSIVYKSALPALSLVLVGFGWWVVSMKTLAMGVAEEDYVQYARLKGVPESRIMMKYVAPNSLLPQVTALALRIGSIFTGAMVTEILFGYPGLGSLIQSAVKSADYNLIMGTITISILAVSITTFVIDILYPFFDPRIRYI